jgi:prepilin signal peptidase PulO-like enzyme (type II secretory pathway)
VLNLLTFPLLSSLLFLAVGAAFGSFGNVLILRLSAGRSILGRSGCPRCGKVLSASELVPVVSFLFLRGKCAGCSGKISWQYPLVETGSALLFLLALILREFTFLPSIVLALVLWLFFLVAVMDARQGAVSDALTFPLLLLSLLYAFFSPPFHIVAPLLGAGFFAFQWVLSKGKWVGSADIFIGAVMGFLLLDWRIVLLALAASYIFGALVAAVLMLLKKKTRKDHLPFIPFLAGGTILMLMWGYEVLNVLMS